MMNRISALTVCFLALSACDAASQKDETPVVPTAPAPMSPVPTQPAPAPSTNPAPAPAAPPAAETCIPYMVKVFSLGHGSNTTTGVVQAYPKADVSKLTGKGRTGAEITISSVGCGDILVHGIEVSVSGFSDAMLRSMVGQTPALLSTRDDHDFLFFIESEAINLRVAPGATDIIYYWTDGINEPWQRYHDIATIGIDAKQAAHSIFFIDLPDNVPADSLTVKVTAIMWTDVASGQRFWSTY